MAKYWFRAKKYGYGWEPCTWQGWLVLGVYVVSMLDVVVYTVGLSEDELQGGQLREIVALFVVLTLLLVAISWRTGEPARWQWGGKGKKTPERRM